MLSSQAPLRALAYITAAACISIAVAPASAPAASGPHGVYAQNTDLCGRCHRLHSSTSRNGRLLVSESETELCLTCHDDAALGSTTSVISGEGGFGQASHHVLDDLAQPSDLTNTCGSCHNPHADPEQQPGMIREKLNGVKTAGQTATELCLNCHDDARSWESSLAFSAARQAKDASGTVVKRTFPGRSVYLDTARNPHATLPTDTVSATSTAIPASRGDCRICHGVHGAPEAHLLKTGFRTPATSTAEADLRDGGYASLCFSCHGGQTRWSNLGAADIASLATTASAKAGAYPGHRVVTTGGERPAPSPLLCSDCHDAHGSERGNAFALSDELGAGMKLDTPAAVRGFCFTCHASSDGYVFDGDTGSYAAVSATATVLGLRRDGTFLAGQRSEDPSATGNWLRLGVVEPAHASASGESCYTCHADTAGTGAGRAAAHAPKVVVADLLVTAARTKSCYTCHATYRNMEDSLGSVVGTGNAGSFHHVLGSWSAEGDVNQTAGYPTSTDDVYCISCHRGHDAGPATLATTLRASIGSTQSATSDYSAAAPFGICVSCHTTSRARDVAGQASDGSTATARVTGGTGVGGYGASAHSYLATMTATSGRAFGADCGKCHGSSGVTHASSNSNLLATLGGSTVAPLEVGICYRCHSQRTDAPAGVSKPKAGRDWYDRAAMSADAESVFDAFSLASKHPVASGLAASVSCANCHNTHAVSSASPVSDPDNTYNAVSMATATDRTRFCLTCHDGSAPTARTSNAVSVPATVVVSAANAAKMNKNTTLAKGHSSANGSISAAEVVACDACHDAHGSSAPKLLGRYDAASGTNRIGSTTITTNTNDVCYACHTAGNQATRSFDSAGYPTDGRWPGRSIYTGTNAIHSASTVVRSGRGAAGGDCKNCHDVHGTSSTYDELVGSTYSPTNYGFCFDCHAASIAGANIAQFYPANSGGTGTGTRAGHATVSTGLRPAGSPLPCYDCHNSHGSVSAYGLEVRSPLSATTSVVVGDAAGEITLTTAAGIRAFCFTCHTSSDAISGSNPAGWNGSAYVAVSSGARIEGIDRVSTSGALRLTDDLLALGAHRRTSTTGCVNTLCHGTGNASLGTYVHRPIVLW